jgi:Tfp pilus assembly protein FimV
VVDGDARFTVESPTLIRVEYAGDGAFLDLCTEHRIGGFDLAFAYEALARAYAVAGDGDQARAATDQALAAAEDITEDEDRDLLCSDLQTIAGQPRCW